MERRQTSPQSAATFHDPYFAANVAGAVRLAKIEPRATSWLWPGRIPLGRLTLVVGDPGLGKSLLTLDIAARVTTGTPWPDECSRHTPCAVTGPVERQGDKEKGRQGDSDADRSLSLSPSLPLSLSGPPTNPTSNPTNVTPSSVLLLNAEDDLAETVTPRLAAAGADLARVVAVPSILSPYGAGDAPSDFLLRRDLSRLASLVRTLPDCRLLVVDPISSYLVGSGNAASEVRRLLAPLAQLAHEHNLAVVVVSHLRKQDGAAIHRTLGSLAYISAARAAWLVARAPNNPSHRLLLPIKNNLAQDTGGLAFEIRNLPLPQGEGRGEGAPQSSRHTPCAATSPSERQGDTSSIPPAACGLAPNPRNTTPPPSPSLAPSPPTPPSPLPLPPSIHWLPTPTTLPADTALCRAVGHPRSERNDAIRWLERTLAEGPLPARKVQDEAEAHGIRLTTLRRAFRELDGQAIRIGQGEISGWLWRLPNVPSSLTGEG